MSEQDCAITLAAQLQFRCLVAEVPAVARSGLDMVSPAIIKRGMAGNGIEYPCLFSHLYTHLGQVRNPYGTETEIRPLMALSALPDFESRRVHFVSPSGYVYTTTPGFFTKTENKNEATAENLIEQEINP